MFSFSAFKKLWNWKSLRPVTAAQLSLPGSLRASATKSARLLIPSEAGTPKETSVLVICTSGMISLKS